MFRFLFLVFSDDCNKFDTSFFESSMLFFNVWSILPDSSKFLAVLIATFLADFCNFFPKGLLAVALINFGVDLITDFPMGRKFETMN